MAIERRFDRIEATFTDRVEAVGTVRRVYYRALYIFGNYDTITGDRQDGDIYEWHYFGTTLAEAPRPYHSEAPVTQNQYIAFPVDFEALDAAEVNGYYYELAYRAGLRKEGYK